MPTKQIYKIAMKMQPQPLPSAGEIPHGIRLHSNICINPFPFVLRVVPFPWLVNDSAKYFSWNSPLRCAKLESNDSACVRGYQMPKETDVTKTHSPLNRTKSNIGEKLCEKHTYHAEAEQRSRMSISWSNSNIAQIALVPTVLVSARIVIIIKQRDISFFKCQS